MKSFYVGFEKKKKFTNKRLLVNNTARIKQFIVDKERPDGLN